MENRTSPPPLEPELQAAVLAQVANAVFITDPDGRIVWVNEAFTAMSGYCFDEVAGSTPRVLNSGVQTRDRYAELWQTILAGESWRGEFVNRHRSGELYTVHQTITPLLDADGQITHFVAVHEDVTPLRASQARLRAIFDHAPDALLLFGDDAVIIEANPAAGKLTGHGADALPGRRLDELIPDGHHTWIDRVATSLLAGGRVHGSSEVLRADGDRVEVEYEAVAGILDGVHLLLAHDVTARRRLEQDLRSHAWLLDRRARQHRALAEVGRFALGTDDHVAVALEAGRRIAELLGPGVESYLTFVPPPGVDDDSTMRGFDLAAAGTLVVQGSPLAHLEASDEEFLRAMAHVLHAAAQRDQSRAHIEHLANHDLITQLPNRSSFLQLLEEACASDEPQPFGVIGLNLDDFKSVNDGLGHAVGDEVLRAVANRLRHELGDERTVARLGSDEFAIFCPGVADDEQLQAIGEQVRLVLREPLATAARQVVLTASVGAVTSVGHPDGHSLLRDAATATRAAKESGRNRVIAFSEEMRQQAEDRFDVASALRAALDHDGVVVHYQPTIDLASGRTVGVEALVRLRQPEGGLLSPAQFIQVAEDTGLIIPLGERVLDIACADAAEWIASVPDFMLSVNLAPEQLIAGRVDRAVERCLSRHGLAPHQLWLELTESELLEAELATEQMSRLRELGVRFAIDDFGTGYSSMKQLRSTAVDMLKIDRTFVGGLADNDRDHALVVAAIDLARTFGLEVVAEGVETHAHQQVLQGLGCELAQGFLWSRPVAADAVTARLAAKR